MSSSLPQIPISVNQKAELLYGTPLRSESVLQATTQQIALQNVVEQQKEIFSDVQNAEQLITTPAKINKIKNIPTDESKSIVYNIVDDYDWTLSTNKKQLASTIPYIRLREFDIVASNTATSLYASIGAISDVLAANRDVITSVVDSIGSKIGSTSVGKAAKSMLDTGKEKLKSLIENFPYEIIKQEYGAEWGDKESQLIKTYGGLYLRQATNAVYKFPYFTKEFVSLRNDFRDSATSGESSKISNAFSNLTNAAESFHAAIKAGTTLPSIVEPGVYIQRPKYFQFSEVGASFSLTFTLFNTLTPDSYLKNSELIKRLLIKNLPQRMSKVVVYPPAIYEVVIPGRAFYPYCYIDGLTVTHEGVKRVISIDGGDEIVPDAYIVTLQINSLTSDVNNFYVNQMGNAGVDMSTRKVVGPIARKSPESSNLNNVEFKKTAETATETQPPPASTPPPTTAPARRRGGTLRNSPTGGNNGVIGIQG